MMRSFDSGQNEQTVDDCEEDQREEVDKDDVDSANGVFVVLQSDGTVGA